MPTEGRLHRMWRLTRGEFDCVGAIADGHISDFTPPSVTKQFVSLVSFAPHIGDPERREHPDGRVFDHTSIDEDSRAINGDEFDTFAEAIEYLERRKQELLTLGWQELDLDPINDPD